MSRSDYIRRINRVIDYIEAHLADDMALEELASVAVFSPYHFHRIFTAFAGESLYQFIRRLRLERAASKLISNDFSITEIALECGFSSSSVFARSFRDFYGMSATDWRADVKSKKSIEQSNSGQTNSNGRKAELQNSPYHLNEKIIDERRIKMNVKAKNVKVENVEDMTVAYVRNIGPYAGNTELFKALYEKLFKWAGARELLKFPETKVLCVYHDDPDLTEESKLRTSICISVPDETEVDGEIGKMVIRGGKYAKALFEIDADQYKDAWNWVCGDWLPDSGYIGSDCLSYELNLNNPQDHPEHKHVCEICIPVKPE